MASFLWTLVAVWCNLSVLLMIAVAAVLLLPSALVAKFSALQRLHAYTLVGAQKGKQILARSPVSRLFVWLIRRCSFGKVASRCRPVQAFNVKASGSTDLVLSWTPRLPSNPFHEEYYVCAWRLATDDGAEAGWNERVITDQDYELAGNKEGSNRLRFFMDDLPEHSSLQVRFRAANSRGVAPWNETMHVKTLARPCDEGGFIGPLGSAGRLCGQGRENYRWTQTTREVALKIPIAPQWKARDLRFTVKPKRIEALHVSADGTTEPLLVGPFPKTVRADEVFWEIEETAKDGRHISVQLPKVDAMDKWGSALEVEQHPIVDTRRVRFYTKDMGAGGGIQLLQ